ncbi:unnamed protein product [Ectocarpus sp. 6 AP-2014]
MFAGTKSVPIAVTALVSMGQVSGQCISAPYVAWYPCGTPSTLVPSSCDRARLFFHVHRETGCVSSNPIVTADFTGPIASWGYTSGSDGELYADLSDDQLSLTFDIGEADLDPTYVESEDYYYWHFALSLDNCDSSYTWSDNFVQLSYVDDEQNTIDLSVFEDPDIDEPDTGICPTPSPVTPSPAMPAPTPAPTMRGTLDTYPPTPSPLWSPQPPTPHPTLRDEAPPTPSPSTSPSVEGSSVALGCYEDDRENRIMDDLALSDFSMTTELCEQTCLGNTYFATQYGRECWCGSAGADYASHGESTDCTYACAGDADETCGGFDAANVYLYTGESTPSPTPSPTGDESGPLSLGCYEDDRENRIMDDLALSDFLMTTELCEQTCLGNTYFATQYGRECWCGSAGADYTLHGESTDCTYACAGDADQTCGGFDAANVYLYTGDDAPTTSTFVGCYQDESDARIMELALTDSSSMTKEMCEAECTGSTYFGMQYGRECFCGGSSTDLVQHGESTACDYECPGDSDQWCGGFYAMSVYSYS